MAIEKRKSNGTTCPNHGISSATGSGKLCQPAMPEKLYANILKIVPNFSIFIEASKIVYHLRKKKPKMASLFVINTQPFKLGLVPIFNERHL